MADALERREQQIVSLKEELAETRAENREIRQEASDSGSVLRHIPQDALGMLGGIVSKSLIEMGVDKVFNVQRDPSQIRPPDFYAGGASIGVGLLDYIASVKLFRKRSTPLGPYRGGFKAAGFTLMALGLKDVTSIVYRKVRASLAASNAAALNAAIEARAQQLAAQQAQQTQTQIPANTRTAAQS